MKKMAPVHAARAVPPDPSRGLLRHSPVRGSDAGAAAFQFAQAVPETPGGEGEKVSGKKDRERERGREESGGEGEKRKGEERERGEERGRWTGKKVNRKEETDG